MTTTRRRRFLDVLRRTAGVGAEEGAPRPPSLDDSALWAAEEQASASLKESGARAERLAAAVARQRGLIDAAAERASVVTAHADGLSASSGRVIESFERLGVVALNAGLEGARVPEAQGRALLLLSEEIRANVRRGTDAAEQLARAAQRDRRTGSVLSARTTTTICPMWVASTRDLVVSSSGGESKMMMRSR